MARLQGKKILMVIAPIKFKDEEYYIPKENLEREGARIITASLSSEATSVNNKTQSVDIKLTQATTDYDAVIFVGGPGATVYLNNKTAHKLAQDFFKENKLVAAICIAPAILANAGILKNKKATVFPTSSNTLKNNKVIYIEKDVVIDNNIITANGPAAAEKFAKAIIDKLSS